LTFDVSRLIFRILLLLLPCYKWCVKSLLNFKVSPKVCVCKWNFHKNNFSIMQAVTKGDKRFGLQLVFHFAAAVGTVVFESMWTYLGKG